MSNRTRLQSEANSIDLEIFRLMSRLAGFEHKVRNQEAKLVRDTNKEDRERTNG